MGRNKEEERERELAHLFAVFFFFFSPVLAVPQTERLEQAISFFNLQTVFKLFENLIALS